MRTETTLSVEAKYIRAFVFWALAFCLLPDKVSAYVWPQPYQQRLQITGAAIERHSQGESYRTSLYFEQGLRRDFTYIGKSEFNFDPINGGQSTSEFGLRKSKKLPFRLAAGLQASGLYVKDLPGRDCQGIGGELRTSIGRSYQALKQRGFAVLSLGRRQVGNCASIKIDTTIGYNIGPKSAITAKLWLERGSDSHGFDRHSDKIEFTATHHFKRLAVELGWRQEMSSARHGGPVIQIIRKRRNVSR